MNEGKGFEEKNEPNVQAQPPPGSTVSEHVDDLLDRYGKVNLGLVAEMRECWNRLSDCLKDQDPVGRSIAGTVAGTLEAYRTQRAEIGRRMIESVLGQLKRDLLPARFLAALRDYSERVLAFFTAATSLPEAHFQALLTSEISRSHKLRYRFAQAILVEALDAINDAMAASNLSLTLFDLGIDTAGQEARPTPEGRVHLLKERGPRVAASFQRWESWEQKRLTKLARAVEKRRRARRPLAFESQAGLAVHWTEQSRLLESSNLFAFKVFSVEQSLLAHIQSALVDVASDNASIVGQYREIKQRLKSYAAGEISAFSAQLDYVPASRRFRAARSLVEKELTGLPERAEIFFRAVPVGERARRRIIFPRRIALKSVLRLLQSELAEVGEEINRNQLRIVQEIERAREVVSFGQELGREQAGGEALANEATANAAALLDDFERQTAHILRHRSLETRLVSVLALSFAESRTIISPHQLRLLRHIGRHELKRATSLALGTFSPVVRDSWLRLQERLRSGGHHVAVVLGLSSASPVRKVEVRIRPCLPAEFTVNLSSRPIPPLYRHLFRLEPVQDPRFLIGREREMQAIIDARRLWDAGRPAAVLIVGQRGSGKTSLINCAVREALSGLQVVRGEFGSRLTEESELEDFVAKLFGCSRSRITEPARRAVILEETERCYLKQVGGYAAIRALQRIISSTCTSTLWLVSINEMAFRFISRATGFDQVFTHRIDAGTATLAELKEALLLRHRLSGLRLHFIPAPENTRKKQEGDQAETVFFDALFKQTSGVFRTAFDIWLGQIDRIEAGVMTMKPIIRSDLAPVVEDLPVDLVFALLAILQHGALTVDEHAKVFQLPVSASRAQLEELLAREIIEQDPGREGLRVRPEAMPLIREALYRRNLLG